MNLENIPNSHRADWIDFRYDALDGKSGYDRDPYSLNIMPENLYFSQLPNSALWREAMPFVKGLLFSSETALVMSPFLENVELLQRARRPLDEENFAPYIKFDKQWQRTALLLVTSLHGEAVFDNPPEQLKAIQSEDERLAALFLVGCVPPERRLTTAIALTQFFSRSVAEKWAVPFLPITLLWNTELLQPVSIAVLFMILRNSLEAPYPEGTACLTDQATLAQIRTYADDSIVPDIIKCGYLAQISSLLRHTAFPWHLNCLHLAPKALIAAQNAINEFGTQWHYHKWPEVYAKPAVQIPLFAALQESLKTYHPREFHQLLARQILENRNLFGLFEEHPLLEQVLQVIATTSPEVVQPTHPYLIYQDLLQRATTEPLYEVEATHTWRLEKLRQAHSSQTEYTAEELPTGGDIAGLTKLVTSLQSRVATLPAMKLKVVEKHVTDNFGDGKRSLAVLCTYLLSNSTLQELLAHGKQGRELVQIAHFQASSVVSTLLKVDNELQEGELLTKREEMLLTLANLLIECRVGQRENLDSYYRLFVPIELQRGCTEAIASSEVGRFVEKVIQNLLNMTMHDEKLLLDLLSNKDPTDLTQAVHISRYLKGRLYRQIGLQYKVTIDLGTSTLPPELLQVSTANLMTTFFRHCTLTSAVNAVMEASKDFFAEGKGRYLEVANLFTEHTQESRGQLDKYFNCDEETTTISFTHQGAAAILKMLGYIGPFA